MNHSWILVRNAVCVEEVKSKWNSVAGFPEKREHRAPRRLLKADERPTNPPAGTRETARIDFDKLDCQPGSLGR